MLSRGSAGIERVLARLDELYAISSSRIGYSPEEDAAHELCAGWMRDAGLEVTVDEVRNLFGHVPGTVPWTCPVWTGSHLDTVPNGGRFDGALGVVAALEVAQPGVAVVAFRDEERGCSGSRGVRAVPRSFLEVHVEQGPVLLGRDVPVGVVTSIAGVARAEVVFEGRAGHAGTTPMSGREDALARAAEYVLRVRDTAAAIEGAVATVGQLAVEPGAVNVIPDRVVLSVDARAPDLERFDRLVRELGIEPSYRIEPVAMAGPPVDALAAALAERGLPEVRLPSGAGHDAGILASRGSAAAMLFVRSLNGGVSHSPDELSSPDDIAVALDVLAAAVARLTA